MPRFVVTGTVTVEAIVEIEAASEDAARQLFCNHVSASASIDEDAKDKVTMIEDSVDTVEVSDIDQATEGDNTEDDDEADPEDPEDK